MTLSSQHYRQIEHGISFEEHAFAPKENKWNKKGKVLLFYITLFFAVNAGAEVIYEQAFDNEQSLKGLYNVDTQTMKIMTMPDGGKALEIAIPENAKTLKNGVTVHLHGPKIGGKQVTVEVEAKNDMTDPIAKWGGGLITVWAPQPQGAPANQSTWKDMRTGSGQSAWKSYRLEIVFPDKISHALLNLGLDGVQGKIYYRNLKVISNDTTLKLNHATNMGFSDSVAGDHHGGWHDQGSDYDASGFPIKNRLFANVPFSIIDPKSNDGKAIIVFNCPKLPNGPDKVEIVPPVNTNGKYLYLLHCSAWGQEKGSVVGTIELTNSTGKTVEIPVIYGVDINEWWEAKPVDNAVTGVQIAAKGGVGAAFVSRFEIPDGFGPPVKVTFRKQPAANAMWMLIAATISETKYKYPEMKSLVIREDDVWKALPQQVIQAPQAGTALDFSTLFPRHEAGEFGPVIINAGGHFEFTKKPGVPVRFFSACMGRDFGKYFDVPAEMKDKEMIERYADQIQRAGYNMVRFWSNSLKIDGNAERKEGWRFNKAFTFSPSVLDRTDYLFYCLKKRGIYVLLSIADATIGYDYCNPWSNTDGPLKEWNLYRNKTDREAWKTGAEKILTHVNPYTKTRWVDDPQIAMIDCNNEQEFAFIRADDRYAELFREFLKKKYSDFAALKKAWGDDADGLASFDDIKTFKPLGQDRPGQLNQDRAIFVTEQETALYQEEREYLRKLGYRGPTTSFLMGKSMRNAGVRKDFDFVAQNSYHAHPSGNGVLGKSNVDQASSIGSAANIIRSFLAARLYNRPFVITEHGHTFWNKFRYEQGFVMGGLSAMNDFDGLTAFFMPVTTNPNCRITSFEIRHDPVLRAAELMTCLMFRREDVKRAELVTRIKMDLQEVISGNAVSDGINSNQLRMGLIGQCFIDQTTLPPKNNELILVRVGSSNTAVRQADSNIVDIKDKSFNLDRIVANLKSRHILTQGNPTSAEKDIFASSTGEILMDCERKFMHIDTPRFQGICAEAGTTAKLKNIEIKAMNRNACIALASVDGTKDIDAAGRLLVFVVTNVLNNEMRFEDTDQRVRINAGTLPLLLETGKFSLVFNLPRANHLKAYALRTDGTRIAELPLQKSGEQVELAVDTAALAGGPALYFELAEK